MKILILGGSGFIGKDFLKRYSKNFKHIIIASRNIKASPVSSNIHYVSYDEIVKQKNISKVLHFAFDHSYKNNIKLAKIAYKICLINQCELLYLSSFVVRDLSRNSLLKTSISNLSDPYTIEKIKVKEYLEEKFSNSGLPLIQIEPGIVYGLSGNWFAHALDVFDSEYILLSNFGNNKSPFIYVGELSFLINDKINNTLKSGRYLVNGREIKTWKDFYTLHEKVFEKKIHIKNNPSNHLHSNFIIHCIIKILIFTKLGKYLFFLTPLFKQIFNKIHKFKNRLSKRNVRKFDRIYRSFGITYFIQSMDFIIHDNEINLNLTKSLPFSKEEIIKEMRHG